MKKTFKGMLALAFCVVTVFATMIFASAISAPKAKVKSLTYNTVTISWAEVKGADGGYEIQRSTSSKSGYKAIATVKKGTTSYKDSKLTTGKTYYYRVRAIDKTLFGKKYSSASSTVKAKPVPAKVTGLKASTTYNSVKLTWSKVSGASGYEVQVYSKKKWKSLKTTSKNTLTITKLKLGTTYQYRVRAYTKKKIYGSTSSSIKATPSLKAPSSFVLKGVTSSSLTLSWSAVDGAKGYEVYNATTKKWTDTKTKRTLTVKKLKAGTKYSFLVRAYSGKYDGTKTKTLSFYTTPSAPTGLKLSKATTSSLDVSWSKVTGAAGYQVQYSTDKKKWTNLSGTSKTTNTIKSLSSGKAYYVRVRAYVKNSNVKDISATSYGSYSSTLTTYTNVTAPKTITLTGVTTSSLNVSWSSVTGATAYEYYHPISKKWVSTKTSRSASITGLNAGTKYGIKVRATGSNKATAESSTFYFITTPAAPEGLNNGLIIGGVIISNSTTDSVTVSWKSIASATAYQVQYSANDGASWTSLPDTTSTSVTLSKLAADKVYKVRVRASVKNSNVSDSISAITYGAYATVDAKTLKTTTPTATITTTSESTSVIRVSWNEVAGAKGYVIERYNGSTDKWLVYDFTRSNWYNYNEIDEDNQISTTSTTMLDAGSQRRSELYRVRIVDADGYLCYASEIAMGETADIDVNVGDYATEVEFIAPEGATNIYVQLLAPNMSNRRHVISKNDYTYSNGKYKVKLALAPDSLYYFTLGAEGVNKVCYITVKTKPLAAPITNTSDANYNASVSSQLLYLAQAINNTKAYTGTINTKLTTSITTKCGDIEVFQNGKQNVALELLFKLFAGDELAKDMTDNEAYSYTFTNGKAKDEKNISINLKSFIEPNTNAYKDAYIYNGISPSSWKDGIKSFSSSLSSNGELKVSFTLKENKSEPVYHNGLLSVLNSSALNSRDFKTESIVVKDSPVNATIASDYILKSYSATAPFTGKFVMSMIADKDVTDNGANVNKGDELLIKMPIEGSSSFSYTFTR